MAAKSDKETNYRRQSLKPETVLLLLALLFLFLVLITFNHLQPGAYIDDAHYIALARSLAAGSPYGYLNFPAAADIAPLFPIGFPLVSAPLVALFPKHYGRCSWLLCWPRWRMACFSIAFGLVGPDHHPGGARVSLLPIGCCRSW